MKSYFSAIFLCTLFLAACTSTPTSTSITVLPTVIPTDIPTQPPTSTPSDTLTPTPLPQGKTIIVTSTSDSGPGTLRQALQDAQPYDTIIFHPAVFPPDAPATINVSSELPHIRVSNLTLDASEAGVILDGSNVPGGWVAGLQIVSSEANTVRGLQVSNFSGPGIAISGEARFNVIGGDRGIGSGPFGQGNQFSHNAVGIDLSVEGTSLNIIVGNLIGTDAAGVDSLGNNKAGIWIYEGAHGNTIGPDNVIAHNFGYGILMHDPGTLQNTITQNSIHDNDSLGIALWSGSNAELALPGIFDFDLSAGTVTGATCSNCTVEIFSDSSDEGATYEGRTTADDSGVFSFEKDVSFMGPNLTATTTDADGNTSKFSPPTSGPSASQILQQGNDLPRVQFLPKQSGELADNRIGISYGGLWQLDNWEVPLDEAITYGVKRVDMSLYELEPPIDWSTGTEFAIPPEADRFIDGLAENGIAMNLILHFWDKAGHAAGEELSTPRFQDDEQVREFLEYVRFVVRHFKGRIRYYTIWSEPDNCGDGGIKCVLPRDYIELARQTIPVIRQEDSEARVVSAPNVLFFGRDHLFEVLRSDVAQLFDVISWHPIYDAAPNIEFFGNYYYEYPSIIQEIKQTASAHGFAGEYWGTELTWNSLEICNFPGCRGVGQTWDIQETDLHVAKYYARGIVMELGLDVGVGLGGFTERAPWSYPTMRNLSTVMAGSMPTDLGVQFESTATNIMDFGFVLPNGDRLFALWTNGTAVEDDPGVSTTLTFDDLSSRQVVAVDVIHGIEQQMTTESLNGDLVLRNLLVKDYPIILRLTG
ncbi:MAG TPA: right-handed parallel beta-helix repeat-containing protein [Anaerolineae bacterium]|nr:right-handed parallel beta-helix repeat-containing protein [Anaerolineae bacterium]